MLYMSEEREKEKWEHSFKMNIRYWKNTLYYYCEIKIKSKDTFFEKESYSNMVRIVIQLEYLLVIIVIIGE